MSQNYIHEEAGLCPSTAHCIRVCAGFYNQSLAGVTNGADIDNIHDCTALVGNQMTYLDPGAVQCRGNFSAFCQ